MPVRIPPHILSLKPYVPGKPIEEVERELGIRGSIKLASNENPIGPSPLALRAVHAELSNLHRYPEGSGIRLKEALARKHGVAPNQIVLGNGSNEVIELLARAFLSPGDDAVMADPSFVVYALVTQAVGARSVKVPLRDGVHDLMAMAQAVAEKTRIVFIANPNNPTGTSNGAEEVEAMVRAIPPDVVAAFDEAYAEYVGRPDYPDTVRYIREGQPVIVFRTFSKIYGLAGLRIGYGVTTPEIADALDRVRQPFNTNRLAQAAALAALSDEAHVARSRGVNEEGKAFLSGEFRRMGVSFHPTEANFFYLPLGERSAKDLSDALLRKGVIVRPMGPAIRVTIGLPEENRRLVEAFSEALRYV
jgi:histidinol-phosphate aminotransferase